MERDMTQRIADMDNTWHGQWTRNPKILDLNNASVFDYGFPHEAFAQIRKQPGLYWNYEAPAWGDGFWNVTRYEDILTVSKDTETFSSAQGINISYGPDADPAIVNAVIGNMISMDPPLHRAYRKIAQPYFTPSRIAGLEPRIRKLASEILDDVVERGECDFMVDVAARLPIAVLCDIMGVPHSDWKLIFDWSNSLIGFEDPEFDQTEEQVQNTFMTLFGYGQQMIADRRANPRDDLMTSIATAEPEDGESIPDHLLNGFFLLMVIAGNETTRNSLSGGQLAFMNHPDQRKRLIQNPTMLAKAVEEVLRWVSPVNHMRRTATRDAVVAGTEISAGDKVVMWYPSANRDESVYPDGNTFDIGRDPNPHVAFGFGEHFCLGARLARLQLSVMFDEVMRRLPDMEPAGDVRYIRTNFINGIKDMPVRYSPARRAA
jgi:cytochrome P450